MMPASPIPCPPVARVRGFTLIEMAVAVFIIALLIGSVLVPLTTQIEQRQISDTQKTLEEIKEAIVGYTVARGYMPCPDLTAGGGSNDGQEDVTGSACTNTVGNVPWATLGVADRDVWGNRFRYRVSTAFAQRSPVFGFTSAGEVQICTTTACTTQHTLTSPNGAAAIILSLGKNGLGATSAATGATNPAPTSADEAQNTGGAVYVSRVHTPLGTPAGEFDDIAVWISRQVLFSRMVAAGKLP